ncbi:MAG: methyltransferase domain-containing protein [Fimbriimonadaceae bacterium]|nr:MAG: methyltransferase domain-containing protein [Fimbriimonadaceae bacterium]
MVEPIERFSGKASAYSTARPTYPQECLNQIVRYTGLTPDARVFDTGAGTGLFTQLLLNYFDKVTLVEPNDDMRANALKNLPSERIDSVCATAESFESTPHSVDLITAAQAFHWFDRDAVKVHWRTILKPTGYVALVWNERTESTPFAQEFTAFLHRLANFDPNNKPPMESPDEEVLSFFSDAKIETAAHSTSLSQQELINLAISRSYFPSPSHPEFEQLKQEVSAIFDRHATKQIVQLPYLCKLFIGQI